MIKTDNSPQNSGNLKVSFRNFQIIINTTCDSEQHENTFPPNHLIYFNDDWLYVKFYKWKKIFENDYIVILKKKKAIVERFYVFQKMQCQLHLNILSRSYLLYVWKISICTRTSHPKAYLGSHHFNLASDRASDDIVYRGTFVNILTLPEDIRWKSMSSGARGDVIRAVREGYKVRLIEEDNMRKLALFYKPYKSFCNDRDIKCPKLSDLTKLMRGGALRIYLTENAAGDRTNITLVHTAKRNALFFLGYRFDKSRTYDGHYTHWSIMCQLSQEGFVSYDFCGYPEEHYESKHGIYKFKKSFGGFHFHIGHQYSYASPLYALLNRYIRFVRLTLARFS